MSSITDTWNRSTTSRMKPGGDLYIRPKTRAEMLAPLAWHEGGVVKRYGELADGTIGYEEVFRAFPMPGHNPNSYGTPHHFGVPIQGPFERCIASDWREDG